MTDSERKALKRAKRQAKREASGNHKRKEGSLKAEMEHRIREHAKHPGEQLTHSYRDGAIRACYQFDEWRKHMGLSNKNVRENKREQVKKWVEFLQRNMTESEIQAFRLRSKKAAYSPASIHTMVAGVCLGLGVEMSGIVSTGTALDKTKSTGLSVRTERARQDKNNQEIIHFAELVGGRKAAYSRLTGADFLKDESGEYCVRFINDKRKKTQYQRIAPDNIQEVAAYFAGKRPDELIFPQALDKNLDLHAIRAEHARKEYERYAKICSTAAGRAKMRRQLWARFFNQEIGNKAWLTAMQQASQALEQGDLKQANAFFHKAQKKEDEFAAEMRDGKYTLRGANRQAAILKDRPTEYDRLALCCVSVFALSHWRNEVTVKHYMI